MMKLKSIAVGVALAAGLLTAGAATAAPIAYTYSGEGSGTVNGVGFIGQAYTIVAIGESTATTDGGFDNAIISATITIAGTACSGGCAFTAPATYRFSSNIFGGTITGIEQAGGGAPMVNESLFGASYDLSIPQAAVVALATNGSAPYDTVATSGGPVQITTNTTNPTFSSAFAAATVPTLSEWAMILLGALLAGGAAVMVQRRRLTA